MGFLIRAAFWFSLVLLLLPLDIGSREGGRQPVSASEALFAAREAAGDVTGMCERKPDLCEIGKSAFQTIGIRASEVARVAYEVLDRQFGEPDPSIRTGSVDPVKETAAVQ